MFTIQTFVWKAETDQMGGAFADALNAVKSELAAYESRTLTGLQISYDAKTKMSYQVVFSCKKGKNTFTVTVEDEDDNTDEWDFNVTVNK